MPIKFLTIPFNEKENLFDEEDVITFLSNKKVKQLKPEFFTKDGLPYWTLCVEYDMILDEPDIKADSLLEGEQVLLEQLQAWRKEKASATTSEGKKLPSYIISTNRQLIDVVKKAPKSLQALREINGFGKKKIDKYGQDIIEIIQRFYGVEATAWSSDNSDQQPTTNNQQPTTNNQQPTTNNQQPTTNNQQPTTNKG